MSTHALDKVRADGWLQQLGEGSQGFSQLCEVVGQRYVAFSVIAGIRITALTVDPRNPAASIVEFEIGDIAGSQRLALSEFRDRLAGAMLSDDDPPTTQLPARVDAEALQTFIGFRYVLLAPLFGIGLEELRVEGDAATIRIQHSGSTTELTLKEFREVIREGVREEAAQSRSAAPFAIDLNVVTPAREASAAGDHAKVVELLGAWPGPLSMLLRTAEGQGLPPETRSALAESLGMLGSAHVALGRVDWAQEILRLAVQWGQDHIDVSAVLFSRLGAAYSAQDRAGEAIGLYRRALALGAPRSQVLPELASCFLARGRHIAALLTAEEALAAGASDADVGSTLRAAKAVLGDPWKKFRALAR